MFYTGTGDKVKCVFCEVEIGVWERTDDPIIEHIKWSPNCALLKKDRTSNVPISFLEFLKIFPKPDECGAKRTTPLPTNKNKSVHTKTSSSESSKGNEKICKICYTNELNVVFLPCGHVVSCTKCAEVLYKCPICRSYIENSNRIYFS